MRRVTALLRRAWAHDKAIDGAKVALALGGTVILCLGLQHEEWLVGLILGVIASALAETEDRVGGRLMALAVTLLCFAVAAFSVELLFPYPWFFVVGLTLSTFGFVMLGAAGERYATISVASLILAIYTMLGMNQHHAVPQPFWYEPSLLLAGAAWYGLLSLLGAALFPARPARQILAHVFNALSRYLALKAALLEPVGGRDIDAQRLALAEQNGRLVGQLNRAREILIKWVQSDTPSRTGTRYLKWYFLAQDIHERASSSHHPYQALSEAFARSDILFRCQRLMQLQSAACARLAEAIAHGDTFEYGKEGLQALDEMAAALAYVETHPEAGWARLTESLADLCRNISTIERLLANAGNPDSLVAEEDSSLRDSNPKTPAEALQRVRMHLTPASSRFRHGLRLALALAAGYGLIHLLDLPQGYWVMLTTLFVCQPDYSGTWKRLGQRVGGTVLGLFVGWMFIGAFPQPLAQLALVVISGVAFFALRAERYLWATVCITVLVLACFSQFGSGYALIWPRLLDTVLGALIAGAAVAFVLPDWQGRRLHQVMSSTIAYSNVYLAEILGQYRSGKRDDLPYRVARRDVHNADAELSTALASMLGEPGRHRVAADTAFRFLCASHTLLGYISALGAHRERLADWQHAALVQHAARDIDMRLKEIAQALVERRAPRQEALIAELATELDGIPTDAQPSERRVIRQLALIYRLLPELAALAAEFAKPLGDEARAVPA